MKRKIVVAALLCLALVTLLALAAPLASAKADFAEATGTETYYLPPNPVTDLLITGNVAHWTFNNVMRIESDSWLLAGYNTTHLVVLFDPMTGAGRCHGTYQIVLDGGKGVWEGTFAGAITLVETAQVWDIHTAGRGVSGAVSGMISRGHDVNGEITGIVIAPHGF